MDVKSKNDRGLFAPRPLVPDAQWHRQALIEGHLAHWLAVAPTENGFLRSTVTRTWQLREQKSTNVVAQSRSAQLTYLPFAGR